MTTTTETRRICRQRTYSRVLFAPLTGRGLMNAHQEAQADYHALSKRYPFECFPLDTMSERLRQHHEEHPDMAAVSRRLSELDNAIVDRIDR